MWGGVYCKGFRRIGTIVSLRFMYAYYELRERLKGRDNLHWRRTRGNAYYPHLRQCHHDIHYVYLYVALHRFTMLK